LSLLGRATSALPVWGKQLNAAKCECHVGSSERAEADAFDAELCALLPLRMDPALAAALSPGDSPRIRP
jgi:hypothetical protein